MSRPVALDCLPGSLSYLPAMIAAEQSIDYFNARCAYFDRQDINADDGAVHFIGDSRFDGMDVAPACPYALNRGIGGDTMRGAINRIDRGAAVNSIHRAGAVVFGGIGVNDICYEGPAYVVNGVVLYLYGIMKAAIGGKWVICHIVPVASGFVAQNGGNTNQLIAQANAGIDNLFAGMAGVQIVNVNPTLAPDGCLLPQYTIDGVHLSKAACDVWRPAIAAGLAALGIV